MTIAGYQVLCWWQPRHWGLHLYRYPGSLRICYAWSLVVWFVEVRRWR